MSHSLVVNIGLKDEALDARKHLTINNVDQPRHQDTGPNAARLFGRAAPGITASPTTSATAIRSIVGAT